MRIAWFTPFEKKSAIGKVGAMICEELAKQHDVTIWTPHTNDLLPTNVPVLSFKLDFAVEKLAGYDYVFYNMGNFATYHREIFEVMQKKPGVVILHDQIMADFWWEEFLSLTYIKDMSVAKKRFKKMIEENYSIKINDIDSLINCFIYNKHPMLEPVISNALAIFTHSAFFMDKLSGISNLPVGYAYLPCDFSEITHNNSKNELKKIIYKARAEERKIIVSTGIVHPLKRVDKVTDVLLANPDLVKKVCYLVIGSYGGEYGEKLKKLADNELQGCLYMLDYQPDEIMYKALQEADLAINLRYPNSEVCSLSLLEQMSFGKPVLVLNSGIYGEMPDNAVLKLELSDEQQGILQALQQLLNDDIDDNIGKNAQNFVKEQCSVENYCCRLMNFVEKIEREKNVADLQNRIIASIGNKMAGLHITRESVPASFANITERLSDIFSVREIYEKNKTVGIWIGYPYEISNLSREGISRAMGYLVSSLLQYYEDVQVEVWCYSFNEGEVKRIFATIPEKRQKRIKYITEKNWFDVLGVGEYQKIQVGDIDYVKDNLVDAVRLASNASVFIPLILYLDRITEAGKKLVAPGYDMAVAEHYADFIAKDPLYIARNLDITWRAKNLAGHNAKFFCISKTVMNSEILKYINNLPDHSAQTIYIPPNIPDYNEEKILAKEILQKRFSLHNKYLFYPTQIRPYKNITTLIKAFAVLLNDYPDLQLVLTGNPKDYPEVEELIADLQIVEKVLLPKNVSELELYSLYHYAAAIPVTSTFEGGFPLQAMEALLMKAPVACADIPIVHERIESFGFTPENCGFPIFEPFDYKALADILRNVLSNREASLERQKGFRDKLLSYTWQEAIPHYYKLLFEDVPANCTAVGCPARVVH